MRILLGRECRISLESTKRDSEMTDKEKQRELIVEIMKADEESGIYNEPAKKQTAVDYLFQELWDTPKDKLTWYAILEKHIAMHKEEELELINFTSKIFELSKSNFNYTLLTNEEILELYNETYVDKNS